MSRLGAAVFALAFVVGVPWALLWHVPWPELPQSWEVASAHLRGWRLPPGALPAAMITALWALWGLFVLALAAEGAARLRGAPLRLRPLGPLQAIAATAVAATAVTPAAAFADTVAPAEDRAEEAPDASSGYGAPQAPHHRTEQGSIERTRTVSGFELGSAELTEQMREDLAPTLEMLADHWDSDVPVEITGHTDPSGDPDRNQELSEERAQAVADHLAESLGEDAPDTEITGRGSDQPVEGPVENQRRVEISYTLAPTPAPAPAEQQNGESADEETGAAGEETESAAEEAEETASSVVTVENASALSEEAQDGPRVVVLEIPDGAVAGAVGFAGLAGGFLLGKRGSFVPRMALSLPRPRLARRPRRLALPAPPARPVPGDDIDERVTVELDHVPGLGLTGKGADGAARRLIANALDLSEPLAVRVLITEREAARLLGGTGRDLLRDRPCEPVTMVPATEDAMAVLAAELHAMAEEERAPLVLVTSPDPSHEQALSGLLLHGQHRGLTAVVLGRWPLGGNCAVDEDGLISQTSQPLSTLFHCSWPGSTAEEVHEAVRAYHQADHTLSERPVRSASRAGTGRGDGGTRERPVLVAEDWDDDDAFTRVGDAAAWERLTRFWDEESGAFGEDDAEADDTWTAGDDETRDTDTADTEEGGSADGGAVTDRDGGRGSSTAPDDSATVEAAFQGFREKDADDGADTGAPVREAAGAAGVDDHDDSWWDETEPTAGAGGTESAGRAGEAEPAAEDADEVRALAAEGPGTAFLESTAAGAVREEAGERTGPEQAGEKAAESAAPAELATAPTAPSSADSGESASGTAAESVSTSAAPAKPATASAAPSSADSGEAASGTAAESASTSAANTDAKRPATAPADGGQDLGRQDTPADLAPAPAADRTAKAADRRSPSPVGERQAPAEASSEGRGTEVRHARVPGRKAGRVRVVRVERPTVPEQGERPVRGPERLGSAPALREAVAARPTTREPRARTSVTEPVPPGRAVDGEEAPPSRRPQPVKPHKAGRGRVWKPRGEE